MYRALAEAEEAANAAADDGLPLRPRPARIRQDDEPLTPEEIDLHAAADRSAAELTATDRREEARR